MKLFSLIVALFCLSAVAQEANVQMIYYSKAARKGVVRIESPSSQLVQFALCDLWDVPNIQSISLNDTNKLLSGPEGKVRCGRVTPKVLIEDEKTASAIEAKFKANLKLESRNGGMVGSKDLVIVSDVILQSAIGFFITDMFVESVVLQTTMLAPLAPYWKLVGIFGSSLVAGAGFYYVGTYMLNNFAVDSIHRDGYFASKLNRAQPIEIDQAGKFVRNNGDRVIEVVFSSLSKAMDEANTL